MTFDVEFVLNDRTFNVNSTQGAVAPPTPGASSIITKDGTIVSPNADFAEVAEWADGNPNNEDRTGYFVCANVPVDGIVMKKATSIDDVKGVTILAPAFAGNYSKDKVDSSGNLLPQYSYVAIIGFVPVRDNGTCTVGGRCMPDDNGCAIPSSNSMGYQVVNRIDADRVLIIIEPNGDMVQRVKTKVNEMQEDIDNLEEAIAGGSGGSLKDYELLCDTTITEDVASVKWTTTDNGEPISNYKDFFIYFLGKFTAEESKTLWCKSEGQYFMWATFAKKTSVKGFWISIEQIFSTDEIDSVPSATSRDGTAIFISKYPKLFLSNVTEGQLGTQGLADNNQDLRCDTSITGTTDLPLKELQIGQPASSTAIFASGSRFLLLGRKA